MESELAIFDVSPIAMSTDSCTDPGTMAPVLENQPLSAVAAGPEGVKHKRCKPESAAEKVNLEEESEVEVLVCLITWWSLSKVSETVNRMCRSGLGVKVWETVL